METRWNKYYPEWTGDGYVKPSGTMYSRLAEVCKEQPYRTAYEYYSLKVTYSDMLSQVDTAAVMWQKLGVTAGDGVCLCMGGCPDIVVSIYALDKLGAVISLLVPDSTAEEFAEFCNGIGARYALMSFNQYRNWSGAVKDTGICKVLIGKYRDFLPTGISVKYRMSGIAEYDRVCELNSEVPSALWKTEFAAAGEAMSAEEYKEVPASDSSEHISFRFVSTLRDRDVVAIEADDRAINTASDISSIIFARCEKKNGAPLRVLCLNEYCYVYGFLMGIHNVLLSGQTLLIYTWFESNNIMPPIRLYKPDTLVAFSGTLARLNASSGSIQALKRARFLFSAGAPLTLAQKAGIVDLMADLGVKPEIHSFYGNSELFECLYCMPELDSESAVGIPLPDVLVKIVDRAAFLDMPVGREGEFAVHSPAMCRSFLMRDGTHYNPFRKLSDGRSWLLTEDIGIENEGGVFFRYGSVRGGFKIKSATVYPSKVEKIIELVAGVKAVACVVTDTVEGPVLTAAVVPEEDYFYDNDAMQKLEERINQECDSMLAEPMRPADICFFAAIPKSSNGRFDYAELGKRVDEIRAQMEDIDEADIEADIE